MTAINIHIQIEKKRKTIISIYCRLFKIFDSFFFEKIIAITPDLKILIYKIILNITAIIKIYIVIEL